MDLNDLAGREYFERTPAGQKPVDLLFGELDYLLCNMRYRKATDLRDHVYALYGVANRLCHEMGIANPNPPPDHPGGVKQAYTEYCRASSENSYTLLLLFNVEDRPDEIFELPSWVPDFSNDWTVGLPSTGF